MQIFKAEAAATAFGINARWAVGLGQCEKHLITSAKTCLEGQHLHAECICGTREVQGLGDLVAARHFPQLKSMHEYKFFKLSIPL